MRVLMVEDDKRLASTMSHLLDSGGFQTAVVTTGEGAVSHVESDEVDLLILDETAETDSIAACGSLRALGFRGGIIILSSSDAEHDVVAGLDAGADDYLIKPYPIAELLSRVRSVLRRVHRIYDATAQGLVEQPRLEIVDHHVVFDGDEIATHGREFDVLALLIAKREQVVLRQTLIDEVWGKDWDGSPMVLSAAVGRIRGRLHDVGSLERVENVRGVGFRLSRIS